MLQLLPHTRNFPHAISNQSLLDQEVREVRYEKIFIEGCCSKNLELSAKVEMW